LFRLFCDLSRALLLHDPFFIDQQDNWALLEFYHRETEARERREAKVEAASSRFEDWGDAGGEATRGCLGPAPPASVGQNLMS